jgi:hypothetical protein
MNCERSCLRHQCRLEYEKSFVSITARLTTVKDNVVRFTSLRGRIASTVFNILPAVDSVNRLFFLDTKLYKNKDNEGRS